MPTYDDAHSQFITQTFAAEDAALQGVEGRLISNGLPTIKLKPEEGRFLHCLVAASGAKRAVEIGTLGGYSGTLIARALAPEGRLTTIEIDPRTAQIARETFEQAGVADKVELLVGDAREVLPGITSRGPFDFLFIDAGTDSYDEFLSWGLANIRPGGVIAAHNAFGYGGLFGPDPRARKATIRAFNQRMADEPRLISTIFPAGDGMAFGVVRGPA
jgi:caffeoyl-CoA O-methyltransferase